MMESCADPHTLSLSGNYTRRGTCVACKDVQRQPIGGWAAQERVGRVGKKKECVGWMSSRRSSARQELVALRVGCSFVFGCRVVKTQRVHQGRSDSNPVDASQIQEIQSSQFLSLCLKTDYTEVSLDFREKRRMN